MGNAVATGFGGEEFNDSMLHVRDLKFILNQTPDDYKVMVEHVTEEEFKVLENQQLIMEDPLHDSFTEGMVYKFLRGVEVVKNDIEKTVLITVYKNQAF